MHLPDAEIHLSLPHIPSLADPAFACEEAGEWRKRDQLPKRLISLWLAQRGHCHVVTWLPPYTWHLIFSV